MKNHKSTPPDEHLCFAIYSAFHAFTGAYRILLEPLNLTYPQYLVMLSLWKCNRLKVTELGDRLFLSTGTLTPLLKRLEERGYIERTRNRKDERQVTVVLTDAGHALEVRAGVMHEELVCMTQLEKPAIRELMDRIVDLRNNLRRSSAAAKWREPDGISPT